MRISKIILIFYLISFFAHSSEKNQIAYRFDLRNLDYNHQLLVFSLQGIVNKKGPRLFLNTEELFWQWRPSDLKWMEYYSTKKGFIFKQINSFEELLHIFQEDINGLVLYDPDVDATRYIACTYAGLENLLPVSPDLLRKITPIVNIPLKRDLTKEKRSNKEWYEWAIKNLVSLCNKKMVYSAGHSHNDINLGGDPGIIIGLDFAVTKKMFVFNLSPADKPSSIYGAPIPGYPDDAKLFDEIMEMLEKPAGVWGWAEPEGDFALRVSSHNNYVMCCGAPNLSFHSKVPLSKNFSFKQRNKPSLKNTKLEEKYYIAFLTNEGDTPKIVAGWQAGGWLNPERGKVAINWGINPILVAEFPAMMEAYYSTATPNDYFFAGVSGAGYVFIDKLPDLPSFARHTARYLSIADESIVDAWSNSEALPLYSQYAEIARLEGMLRNPRGEGRIVYLKDGTPLVEPDSSLWYISGHEPPNEIASRIRQVAKKHKPPFFIEVYGGVSENCPVYYKKIMDELGNNFKAVRLDEMMLLAKLAGQLEVEPQILFIKPPDEGKAIIRLRSYSSDIWKDKLEFKAPPGYKISIPENTFQLKKGTTKEIEIKVSAGHKAVECGFVEIRAKDKNIKRTLEVKLLKPEEVGFEEMFRNLWEWEKWSGGGAEIRLIRNGVEIECPPNLPFSAVERTISVDLDKFPILMIDVRGCDKLWALKVRPIDDMKDICLVADTSRKGIFRCDIPKATGWKGKKSFKVIIFAVGEGGKVEVGWLRMVSLN